MANNKPEVSGKKKKNLDADSNTGEKFSLAQISQFTNEVKNEFNKIAWPEKKHVIGSTGVVIILVMLISFYLGAVDLALGKLIGLILK